MEKTGRSISIRPRALSTAVLLVLLLGAVALPVQAKKAPQAVIMKIEGGISQALSEAIKRNITSAEERGIPTFILELDTPGGTIEGSRDLADFIFQRQDIDIIAYVHNDAYSGGTMVALACKEIYMDAAVGRMGDVAPVGAGGQIMSEKLQTVVRETMLTYARARGYPEALVKAMVTPEIQVYRVVMADDPRPRYVTGDQLQALQDGDRAVVRAEPIVPMGQLLTMHADKAVEYGFAKQTVGSTQALYDALDLDAGRVQRLYLTGSEKLLAFLDMFSPMFIVVGFVLIFMELNNPGFGLPGILGLGCFVLFFLVKWTLHYARLLELILFFIGLALIAMEVFVIPGFGVAGIGGIVLVFVSLLLMFQEFGIPTTEGETSVFLVNILKVTGALAGSAVGIAILLRMLPSMPGFQRLVLQGNLAAAHAGEIIEQHAPGLAQMVGEVGESLTMLRPSGRARFGEVVVDVVTQGEFIEKGERIQIHEVHGNRVVVVPYREA